MSVRSLWKSWGCYGPLLRHQGPGLSIIVLVCPAPCNPSRNSLAHSSLMSSLHWWDKIIRTWFNWKKNVDKCDKHSFCRLRTNAQESLKSLFSSDLVIHSLTQQIFLEFLHVPDTLLGFRNAVVNKTVTSKQEMTDKKQTDRYIIRYRMMKSYEEKLSMVRG